MNLATAMAPAPGMSGTAAPDPARLPRLLAVDPAGRDAPTGTSDALTRHRARYGNPPWQSRGHLGGDRAARRRLIDAVTASGLRGRGGAGFPTGRKMATVAAGRRQAVVIANGCESEPASSKDAALLALAPHLVLDGVVLAGYAVGADEAYVCVHRGDDRADLLRHEIARRTGDPVRLRVVEVPRRYVSSEESALVRLINSGEARPSAVPPRPFERGVRNRPTLVDNVETLAHLAQVCYFGPDWFRRVGTPTDPGSTLVTVAGAVRSPGVYEMALGTTLDSLLALAGGPSEPVQAALVGGYFGTWVPLPAGAGTPLSHDPFDVPVPAGHRSGRVNPAAPPAVTLGAGAVVALPAMSCGLAETARVLGYLAEESARQCGPCMFGLPAIASDLAGVAYGRPDRGAYQRLAGRMGVISGRGACRHPDGAIRLATSALSTFQDDLRAHLNGKPCRGLGRAPLLALPGPAERDRGWR